jgi:hypothetical protein
MIEIAPSNDLAAYVVGRLPEDYLITPTDVAWLEECSNFLQGGLTPANVLQAVKDAVEQHGDTMHVDPYELLVDAGICDADLNLVDSSPS